MYDRGAVVVASDPFGNTPRRPYLIISGQDHPFAGHQYIALGITMKEYPEGLSLVNAFETGTLNRESFVSPWAVISLMDIDIDRAVARLATEFVDTAVETMTQYVFE
jgi:mRNA interferase MazF